ncbi:lytic polysaccharide monooxygenase auxiliary activity family 9 protein [Allostreptomyces psammosilenae]|uniref:Chitin-binding protein n=1 Tax=Allostreptomyces psammosilenae TaxID=1892865 RepID=A0A853A3A6_9ACTN|nr:lytic polysaccharide monooxygenase [Allostreptomyces psammosilenae]NYI07354.1 chitin-binding protein [Allostreptomyces psammosilenae]
MKISKTRTLGALAALAGSIFVVMPTQSAQAHGGMTYPATRTYACYVDGLAGGVGGDVDPKNPACAEAVRIGGKTALWNWFGNLISNAGGRHQQIIPNGNLCGPQTTFAGFRQGRTDWPTTQLTSGSNITFRYNAWAAHPGTWYQYVTKDGWNPNEPLGWDDLEPVPFDQVTNPPINGSGPHGREYTWNATLPSGKSGYHIIYSIWQRSDSPEAFYNCSDVIFR